MISASTILFVCVFAMAIYMNGYFIIKNINPNIEIHHLKYIKFIPISVICLYELKVLLDVISVLSSKESIITTFRTYNINNFMKNNQVLDAEYAYSLLKKVGIVSFTTHVWFTGFVVSKLWIEERKITQIIDWNRSVLAYSKSNSRSSITNVDISSHCGENIYSTFFWMSIAKISCILIEPLMLFSVVNLKTLPNILYTLFIDSGKEIYIVSCINMGLLVASICMNKTKYMRHGNLFIRMIMMNIFVLGLYLYWCVSKQYGIYEFMKVQNYALSYTGVYSIVINLYIYQVCNMHYITKRDYEYEKIPNSEEENVEGDDNV